MALNFGNIKDDLYRMVGVRAATVRDDIKAAVFSAIQRAQADFAHYGNWGFLEQLQDTVYIPLAAPYSTGTVTVTLDSKTVTGSGTTWTKDMEGSFFSLDNSTFYEIRTFVSATSLTLAIPYQFTTASAQTYKIYKRFYPLPLNFSRPSAVDAKLMIPGSNSENVLAYSRNAGFSDLIKIGQPAWFSIVGNTPRLDYYNTGTVQIATSSFVSTWSVSSGTLPTDIVDREIRIQGETNPYAINSRLGNQTLSTYFPYTNPSDGLDALTAASVYAITPRDTQLVGFSSVADQRYVFAMPYIKKIPDMLADSDVSPIVLAGFEDALLAKCREKLARDGRTAMRGDLVTSLIDAGDKAMALAWSDEQYKATMELQDAVRRPDRIQVGPSWING